MIDKKKEKERYNGKGGKFIFWDILKFIINILVTVGVTGIIANQIIQPLLSPRLSDFEIKPLYIQGEIEGNQPNYYIVSQLTYKIDVPLLIKKTTISLDLPLDKNPGSPFNIPEIICDLHLNASYNPYIKLDFSFCNKNFVGVDQINNSRLSLLILPDAFEVRTIEVPLLIREKFDIRDSSCTMTNPAWYTKSLTYPTIRKDLVCGEGNSYKIGYGNFKGLFYIPFYEMIIRNNGNLNIRAYYAKINKNYRDACLNYEKLNTANINGGEYIIIDLEPYETKNILILGESTERKDVGETDFKFNLDPQTTNKCFTAWNKYLELKGLIK